MITSEYIDTETRDSPCTHLCTVYEILIRKQKKIRPEMVKDGKKTLQAIGPDTHSFPPAVTLTVAFR